MIGSWRAMKYRLTLTFRGQRHYYPDWTMRDKTKAPDTMGWNSGGRFEEAYRVLETAIQERAFPGCAFGVVAGGGVVLEDALGRFTYDDDAAMVSASTVFDLASVTKVVATTAMAMVLHQRGLLDVDVLLSELLPAWVAGRSTLDPARRVTVRHLLAHNSGLPGYVQFFKTNSTAGELISACLRLSLEVEPETRAEYSDPGFILLGRALETLVGEDLAGWTQREIFAPLGMTSTRFRPDEAEREAIPPTEVDSSFRRRRIQGEVQDENASLLGGVAGHAGLFSNAGDILRFAASILKAGSGEKESGTGHCLFLPKTLEKFAQRQAPPGSSRALGWDTPSESSSSGRYFSRRSIGHLGYSGCSLWIDLDNGCAIVLLTNRTWPDRICQKIKQVRPAFHDAIRRAL